MTRAREPRRTEWDLEVLVSAGCGSCGHALTLVRQLQTTHPHLAVTVTDVDQPGWSAPPGFVGTPTFLAGGRILSLGNPTPETLRAAFTTGAK